MKFKKGESGNLAGRPKGSLNKFTQVKNEMVEIWSEEDGKEKFRALFNDKFVTALKQIICILPKDVTVGTDPTHSLRIEVIFERDKTKNPLQAPRFAAPSLQ